MSSRVGGTIGGRPDLVLIKIAIDFLKAACDDISRAPGSDVSPVVAGVTVRLSMTACVDFEDVAPQPSTLLFRYAPAPAQPVC